MSGSDQIPEVTNERGFLDAALWYAEHGFKIHPLRPGTKRPILPEWPTRISSDLDVVYQWWTQWPSANIGAPTGVCNGFVVIDIDVKNDPQGVSGYQSMICFEQVSPGIDWSGAVRAVTPSGGMHLFFANETYQPTRSPWLPDVDFLGDRRDQRNTTPGRQVLLPPSVREYGGVERAYRYLGGRTLADLATIPGGLTAALETPALQPAQYNNLPNGPKRGSLNVGRLREVGFRAGERDSGFQSLAWTLVLRHYPHFDVVKKLAYEVWERTDEPTGDPYPWQQVEDKLNRAWQSLEPRLLAEHDWSQRLRGRDD